MVASAPSQPVRVHRVGKLGNVYDLTQELRHGSPALQLQEVQAFNLVGPKSG